ncbi:hypothetical protein THRCLA_20915 [Thraustotheca clavata]|uniref:Secreted protein n=1 Tax=Thraustotheca clavata TaxID=74557 RepID=A0A1W0A1Z6_9STRA|nr:hypothetical protein THRCLA_20915 [Thraustotheca clavata]
MKHLGVFLLFIVPNIVAALIGDYISTQCTTCWGLQYCSSLNGLALPDPVSGYTRNATTQLQKQGVCEDIDKAVTLLTVFGSAYQFKDTDSCRALVYKFNCLSWAANGNTCANAPSPPCRSMCVEIADTCVFQPFYSMYLQQVCGKFPCTTSTAVGCIAGSNELDPSFNRCTLHDDYLTLQLSGAIQDKYSFWLISVLLLHFFL